jgi:hypothetical protein
MLVRRISPAPRDSAGWLAPAADVDLGVFYALCAASCVDGHDDGLRAEAAADLADQFGARDCRRVDADLVCACVEDGCGVVGCAYAAAHGEGDEELGRRASHGVKQGSAALVRRGNVEQDDLIGSRRCVAMRQLRRVACVNDVDELYALHNAPASYVQTGNNSLRQHVVDLLLILAAVLLPIILLMV